MGVRVTVSVCLFQLTDSQADRDDQLITCSTEINDLKREK